MTRDNLKDSNDEVRYTRKYNQRTKEWNVKVVKEEKDFGYIPLMMAKIFRLRLNDVKQMDRHVSLSEDDPSRIAPTIAHKQPEPTKTIIETHQSRFLKFKKELFKNK